MDGSYRQAALVHRQVACAGNDHVPAPSRGGSGWGWGDFTFTIEVPITIGERQSSKADCLAAIAADAALRADWSGARPAAGLLSFASPKENNQRKGDPTKPPLLRRGPLRSSVLAGGCTTRPYGPQTVLADSPREALRCSAASTGLELSVANEANVPMAASKPGRSDFGPTAAFIGGAVGPKSDLRAHAPSAARPNRGRWNRSALPPSRFPLPQEGGRP